MVKVKGAGISKAHSMVLNGYGLFLLSASTSPWSSFFHKT